MGVSSALVASADVADFDNVSRVVRLEVKTLVDIMTNLEPFWV